MVKIKNKIENLKIAINPNLETTDYKLGLNVGNEKNQLTNRSLGMVDRLIDGSINYVSKVVTMERTMQVEKFRYDDPLDYQQVVTRLDQRRRSAHDSFMAILSSVNHLATDYGLEPIYEGSEDRAIQGDFAMELALAYTDDEGLKQKILGKLVSENRMSNSGLMSL